MTHLMNPLVMNILAVGNFPAGDHPTHELFTVRLPGCLPGKVLGVELLGLLSKVHRP